MMESPLCPYFGSCGGCVTQHLSYAVQLEQKTSFLRSLFMRASLPFPSTFSVFSDTPYHYRNRMDFAFFSGGLGLRKKGRFDSIIPIRSCPISNDCINRLLSDVWTWFEAHKHELDPFDRRTYSGVLKYAVIRASSFSDSSSVSFILNSDSLHLARHIELIKKFAETTSAANVVVGTVDARQDLSISSECFAVKGSLILEEMILQKKIHYHSQSFFQNNAVMAEKMVSYCTHLLSHYDTKKAELLDLYGGAGTFGVPLGSLFSRVFIFDNAPLNIACAEKNLASGNVSGLAKCGDAAGFLKLPFNLQKKLFMIVDPPRTGIERKTLQRIISLKPSVLLYVSCNPEQMVRELKYLLPHYTLTSLALFDLFPQTPHIEAIAELVLSS